MPLVEDFNNVSPKAASAPRAEAQTKNIVKKESKLALKLQSKILIYLFKQ